MTAGQARGLARAPGVFRVEEDFEVRAFLDDLRDTFGIDAARADYGPSGAGTGICIVDTGIDHLHEQLDNGKVIGFCDATAGGCLVDAGGNSTTLWETTPFDDHGHGTHVGSIAAGDGVPVDTGNATAVARADRYKGVAPDAALLGAKVLTAAGTGTASDIISGVEWCVGHPEVDIINASLGSLISSDGTSSIDTAFNCAADPSWVVPGAFSVKCRYRKQDGKIVVLAAGNSGPAHYQIGAPAAAHLPITVGAIGDTYAHTGSGASFSSYAIFNEGGIGIAHFSSRGPTADERIKPDVAAPGWNVRAADFGTGTGYVNKSGTSMAAPTVAGAAALALEASATPLTNAEIKTLLENTAQDWGAPGKDIDFGAGVFDGRAFVGSAAGIADPEPMAFPTHEVIEDSVPDFGDWTYPFEVTDPDTAIMITVFNGGTWTCNWLSTICVRASAGADLEAELIDPGGAVLDLSTCSADFDTPCGVGEVWSGQTMFYDGSGGRQETLIARPPLALGTYTVRLFPFNGDASDAEPESSFIMDLSRGPLTTSGGPGGPQPPVAKAGPDQAVPDTDGDGFDELRVERGRRADCQRGHACCGGSGGRGSRHHAHRHRQRGHAGRRRRPDHGERGEQSAQR
jgi:serine protease AprX